MLYVFLVLFLYYFFSVFFSFGLAERASEQLNVFFFVCDRTHFSLSLSRCFILILMMLLLLLLLLLLVVMPLLLPLCVSKFLISYVFLHYMFHSRFAKQITQTNSKFSKRQNKGAQFIKRQEFLKRSKLPNLSSPSVFLSISLARLHFHSNSSVSFSVRLSL